MNIRLIVVSSLLVLSGCTTLQQQSVKEQATEERLASCLKDYQVLVDKYLPYASELAGKDIHPTLRMDDTLAAGYGAAAFTKRNLIALNSRSCNIVDKMQSDYLMMHELGHFVAHVRYPALAKDSYNGHELFTIGIHEGAADDFAGKMAKKAGTYASLIVSEEKWCKRTIEKDIDFMGADARNENACTKLHHLQDS